MSNEPAFAAAAIGPSDDAIIQTGMTLRDWFAGQAIPMAITIVDRMRDEIDSQLDAEVATFAYGIADAMLEAREQQGE